MSLTNAAYFDDPNYRVLCVKTLREYFKSRIARITLYQKNGHAVIEMHAGESLDITDISTINQNCVVFSVCPLFLRENSDPILFVDLFYNL